MFKTLALATAVAAHEFTPYAEIGSNGDFPAITTPMTFVQNAGQENFQILMDQTKGSPDPPTLGTTEQFTISGLATHPHIQPAVEALHPYMGPWQRSSFTSPAG